MDINKPQKDLTPLGHGRGQAIQVCYKHLTSGPSFALKGAHPDNLALSWQSGDCSRKSPGTTSLFLWPCSRKTPVLVVLFFRKRMLVSRAICSRTRFFCHYFLFPKSPKSAAEFWNVENTLRIKAPLNSSLSGILCKTAITKSSDNEN